MLGTLDDHAGLLTEIKPEDHVVEQRFDFFKVYVINITVFFNRKFDVSKY